MFNFTFPWTKRREARKAAEQKARASAISLAGRTGLASVPLSDYSAELRQGEVVIDAPMAAAMRSHFDSAPSYLVAGGGAFDSGGASGDWGGSSCSSSGSDSSSGSSDSSSSCSSD